MINLNVRPEVAAFALAMEERLRANDHKGGWRNDSVGALSYRAGQEFVEFKIALHSQETIDKTELRHEAADVANFLMMILDVADALAATDLES